MGLHDRLMEVPYDSLKSAYRAKHTDTVACKAATQGTLPAQVIGGHGLVPIPTQGPYTGFPPPVDQNRSTQVTPGAQQLLRKSVSSPDHLPVLIGTVHAASQLPSAIGRRPQCHARVHAVCSTDEELCCEALWAMPTDAKQFHCQAMQSHAFVNAL